MKINIDEKEYKKLFDLVISDIPITNEEKVFAITFIAPPGTGKSTVSKILSKKLNVYVTANDKIRRIVEKLGINPDENKRLVEQLANDRTVYMLENKTSMIIDANMQFFWENACQNFKNYNAKLYFVKLQCDDDKIIERIKERSKNFGQSKENYSRAGVEEFYKYKEKAKQSNFPEDLIFYTIDASKSLDKIEEQIEELVNKIGGELND